MRSTIEPQQQYTNYPIDPLTTTIDPMYSTI